MEQPLAVVRRSGRSLTITEANPAFIRMTGYEIDRLQAIQIRQLFPKLYSNKQPALVHGIIETTLKPSFGSVKPITMEIKPLPCCDEDATGRTYYLIIAKDMSADKWLEQQSSVAKALNIGICDHEYIVRKFHQNYSPLTGADHSPLHQSIFDFLDPNVHEMIREQLSNASIDSSSREIVVRTVSFEDMSGLEMRATICPIFDGFGAIQEFAFSVWDLKEANDSGQPGMKLKIWMAKRDISTSQLSLSTGISIQTISKLRNGKITKPQRLTAELIASELRVEVSDIWSEVGRR
ncbi:transcriptional regulator, XRE family [Paenibacillus curdlanolyticus YK9]|uniref:Transcriptional regulator, XRE family n=2 Tax=Paenibacillus curdlanolyticus TaxID=59840 RepID=E0ICP0_9BACL|nr:transcriptional regulator, XRE family [Paenibacillus curdlanolyticus YK9]